MLRKKIQLASIVIAMIVPAFAQVQAPVMGYLPEGGTLRTIYGLPFAGSVGDPRTFERPLSLLEISPDQTRGLAVTADTSALTMLAPDGEQCRLGPAARVAAIEGGIANRAEENAPRFPRGGQGFAGQRRQIAAERRAAYEPFAKFEIVAVL